jgi:hypothetical protein
MPIASTQGPSKSWADSICPCFHSPQVSQQAFSKYLNILDVSSQDQLEEEEEDHVEPSMPDSNINVQVGTYPLWLACLPSAGAECALLAHCHD